MTLRRLAFVVPAWLYLTVFYLYPLAVNVRMGFQEYTVSSFYTGVAPLAGLRNYREVFRDPAFAGTLTNTVLFTAGSIALQFAIGLALARRCPT